MSVGTGSWPGLPVLEGALSRSCTALRESLIWPYRGRKEKEMGKEDEKGKGKDEEKEEKGKKEGEKEKKE